MFSSIIQVIHSLQEIWGGGGGEREEEELKGVANVAPPSNYLSSLITKHCYTFYHPKVLGISY